MSSPSMNRWIIVLAVGLLCGSAALAQPRPPFGQPNQPGQPFPGQPNQPGQPFPGQPNQPGVIPGQPNQPGQPFPGQPNQPTFPKQDPFGPDPEAAKAAGAAASTACGGMLAIMLIGVTISVVSMIVWIFVTIWVAKDAKARGMDNGTMWAVLVFFLGVLGLIIYLVSRPSGTKKPSAMRICRECGKKFSRASRRCPQCDAVYSPKVTR